MDKGAVFWVLTILWLVFGIWGHLSPNLYAFGGSQLLTFVLFALLGWKVFGPAVK